MCSLTGCFTSSHFFFWKKFATFSFVLCCRLYSSLIILFSVSFYSVYHLMSCSSMACFFQPIFLPIHLLAFFCNSNSKSSLVQIVDFCFISVCLLLVQFSGSGFPAFPGSLVLLKWTVNLNVPRLCGIWVLTPEMWHTHTERERHHTRSHKYNY